MTGVGRGLVRLGKAVRHRAADSTMAQLVALDDPAAALLFEADGTARLVIDRAGTIRRASDGVRRLLGRVPEGPVVVLFATDSRATTWAVIEAAMAGGQRAPPGTTATCLHLDGTVRETDLAVLPVAEHGGRIAGAVLVLHDVAAQRALEAQLVHSRKLQAVGELAGGIAHDFNNLLQAIQAAAEALSELGLDSVAQADLAQISAAATRGAALVRQLLAFGRQQTLQPRPVAVNPAVSAIAALLRHTLGESVQLELALEEPGRWVRVDPGQLDQVLVNLAVNARDAMPSGGTLHLRSGHRTLLAPLAEPLETIPPGRYVTIDVADTGSGIPLEVLPRIFEPFFTTKAECGTGLGLATVLGIVRQSGGYLQVQSVAGQGTTMRILLPRIDPPASDAPAMEQVPPAPRAAAADGRTVLLVEDEDAVRHLAARALARQGWQVLAAESGEDALARLGVPPAPIAALVTDMVMPGMDGAALVHAVRAALDAPALPAIIVSGYAEPASHAALNAAATVFLAKPYSPRDLAERLGALTGQRAG